MTRDIQIRPARLSDAEALGRIYVESWREAYESILPQSYLDGLNCEKVSHAIRRNLVDIYSRCLIAASGQIPLGYILGGARRGDDPVYSAEIYELYLAPAVQRQGIGRQLLAQMATKLHQAGFHTLLAWVLSRNPNRFFYAKCGGIYQRTKSIVHAGQILKAEAYGWIDITLAM